MTKFQGIVLLSSLGLFGQTTYKTPPPVIRKVLNAPATPVSSASPTRTHLLLLEPDRYPPIAELAEPMLRLAGLRINPKNNAPRMGATFRKAELIDLKSLSHKPLAIPAGTKIGPASWSKDGSFAAFLVYHPNRVEIAVLTSATAQLRTIPNLRVAAAFGDPLDWMPDNRSLIVQLIPAERGPAPVESTVPPGPGIQESFGKAAPAPTFQDLLSSEYDEKLFDYYCTSQTAIVDIASGKATNIGKPAIYAGMNPSPDGKYILAEKVHRPYSWVLPAARFPLDLEIWRPDGTVAYSLAKLPLADRIPIDGVRAGPRSIHWLPNQPSSIVWTEAMDGGNPKEQVPNRDRVMIAAAPFDKPREFTKSEQRAQGLAAWFDDGRAWMSDYERRSRRLRTFVVNADGSRKEIASRNQQDRYRDMGSPVMAAGIASGGGPGGGGGRGERKIRSSGDFVLLTGAGASPAGDHPFLDRFNVVTGEKKRLFESAPGYYEVIVSVLDDAGTRLVTRRESAAEPPNFYLLENGKRTALTNYTDPAPELRQVTRKRVSYKRADGVPLHFTLYLPPGYKEGTRLPTVMWAYPLDYSDSETAGQVTGSLDKFTTLSGASHMFFLLQGYAILDDASLPVVGDLESFNNSYLEQVVSGAKAAIDKAVELGVTDPKQVGVGGHSYGGFMTANLLAHSDLFAAGIARSGAYNRTLTPFGFQTERRTLWEAPETYLRMSPFLSAHKINEPILLIHGEADNNTGTFPIQSERMFTAIRGNGGTVRFVRLPHESHGYAARESVEHTLAEMIEWFDRHVKNRQ